MQIHNAILTGSTTVYGPINILSGSLTGTSSYAATSSYSTAFTVGGTLTAQTLVVQTITSSIEYSSGSNIFGSVLSNTQTMTGSVNITGSIKLNNSKVIISDDAFYTSGVYSAIGFGGVTNGNNRIFAGDGTLAGLFIASATNNAIYFRPAGKASNDMGIFPNGNTALGVNFSLPTATLHISGSGSGSLMQISSTVSSSIFYVSGSGNIGIGTTSPTSLLNLYSSDSIPLLTIRSLSGNSGATGLRFSIADNTVTTDLYAKGGIFYVGEGTTAARGAIVFANNSDAGSGNVTTANERMRITNVGNVGIGTTSPSATLQINNPTTGSNALLRLDTGDSNRSWAGMFVYQDYFKIQSYGAGSALGHMSLQPEGNNVGIGTTTMTYAKLSVYNNTNDATYGAKIQGVFGPAAYQDSDATQNYGAGTSETQFLAGTTARPAMISLGGDVNAGEGTGVINFFRSTNTDTYRSRAWIWSGINTTGTANQHGGFLAFSTANDGQTNPQERMRITSAGSVGINTTSPSYTLDVSGSGRFYGSRAGTYWDGLYVRNTGAAGTGNSAYIELNARDTTGTANNATQLINVRDDTSGNHRFVIRHDQVTGDAFVIRAVTGNIEATGSMKSSGFFGNKAVTVSALNTDYLLIASAYNGIVVVRDNTTGGSGCYLIDPNAGTATISSNVNGTIAFTYSGGSWYIKKTAGTVPTYYTWAFLGA